MPQHLRGLQVPVVATAAPVLTGHEADGISAHSFLNHFVEADESTTADEQNLAGVDLDAVLVRVLAATLGRHVGDGSLQHLQQGLLNALS